MAGDHPKVIHSSKLKMKRKTFMESWVEKNSNGERLDFQEDVLMKAAELKKPPELKKRRTGKVR